MATTASYYPIVGDYDAASFILENSGGDPVPRNAQATVQGPPRSGQMRWFFNLNVDDPQSYDEAFLLYVPVRTFQPSLVQEYLDNNARNTLQPLTLMMDNLGAVIDTGAVFRFGSFTTIDDVVMAILSLTIPTPSEGFNVNLLVDFLHTSVN